MILFIYMINSKGPKRERERERFMEGARRQDATGGSIYQSEGRTARTREEL